MTKNVYLKGSVLPHDQVKSHIICRHIMTNRLHTRLCQSPTCIQYVTIRRRRFGAGTFRRRTFQRGAGVEGDSQWCVTPPPPPSVPVSYGGVLVSTAAAVVTTNVAGQRRALGGGRRIHGGYMTDEEWEWERWANCACLKERSQVK